MAFWTPHLEIPMPNHLHTHLVAAAVLLLLTACHQKPAADPRTLPPLVSVATARPEQSADHTFTGIVTARVQSNLGFRIPGKIIERLVNSGETVTKGQPLLRLDANDVQLSLAAHQADVLAARARWQQTSADEVRLRFLLEKHAVSQQDYDLAKATADSSKAALAASESKEKVAQNETQYATLYADVDGVVINTLSEPGQVVTAGQTVIIVAANGPREAVINLPENIRPALGSTAVVHLYNQPKLPHQALLRELSASAHPTTRTFEGRYTLEGAAADAPLGTTVTLRLPRETSHTQIAIPIGALYDSGRGPGVWTINDQSATVTFRPVQIDHLDAENIVLKSGLTSGERIVALGAHLLSEGAPVRIAEPSTKLAL